MGSASGQVKSFASWESEQVLADRYRVEECIRQSATCQLYRAQDVFRGSFHLVLRPSPRLLVRQGAREWFEQYCQNVLSVPPHPNVVACERMAAEGGLPFLVMENVEGQGWDSAILDGSLTELRGMLDVATQVAEGLAWLHGQGWIHYNVKPANVLISSSGIAKVWKHGEPDAKTRAYASPEQTVGDRSLTQATDVWSWAVSVLHMFVGSVGWPSGAEAAVGFQRYLGKGPTRRGTALMPGALAELVTDCFRSDPDERVITMPEVVEALKGIYESAVGESYAVPALPIDEEQEADFEAEEDLVDLLEGEDVDTALPVAEEQEPAELEPPAAPPPDVQPAPQPGRKRPYRSRSEGLRGSRRKYRRS